MKIKHLVYFIFCISCSTIKTGNNNNGTISIGDSNYILTKPDQSNNLSNTDIEIKINFLKEEIKKIENEIWSIENNKNYSIPQVKKKKEIKNLEQEKNKRIQLIKELERLIE